MISFYAVGDPFSSDPFTGSSSADPFGEDPFDDAFKGSTAKSSTFAVDLPPKVSCMAVKAVVTLAAESIGQGGHRSIFALSGQVMMFALLLFALHKFLKTCILRPLVQG